MRLPALICLGLVLLNLAVYFQVRTFDFVNYDDGAHIYNNLEAQRGITRDSLEWAFSYIPVGNYIPITTLTYLLDFDIHGLDPGGYHLMNLAIHIVNSVLLFLLLLTLTRNLWPSALVAALFAIHPLHVESVAWISARKDLVSTFFGFLALFAYARYVRKPGTVPFVLCAASLTLGLLSKSMLVTLPFVCLLLDYWPLDRYRGYEGSPWRFMRRTAVLAFEKLPLFVIAAIFCVVAVFAQRQGGAVVPVGVLSFSERLANVPVAYLNYLEKTLLPIGLIPFYPHAGDGLSLMQVILSSLILLGLSIACVLAHKRYPYLLMGWLWFLGTLVPVIGLVQVGGQAVADRYTYFPLIGLFVMAAWGVASLAASRARLHRLLTISAVAALAVFSLVSWQQTQVWRNSIALFEHTLRVSPKNPVALANLGEAYIVDGRFDEAIEEIEAVLEMRPKDTGNLRNLGLAYRGVGRYDEAIERFSAALRIDPDSPRTHNHLGIAYRDQKNRLRARVHFERAIELDPDYLDAHVNLGNIYLDAGLLRVAVKHYRIVLERNPNQVDGLTNLGAALIEAGDYTEAVRLLTRSLELAPDDALTRVNLAVALFELGRIEKAHAEIRRALEYDPEYTKAIDFLQHIREQSP